MKAVYVPKSQIDSTLSAEPVQGKHSVEPFLTFFKQNSLPFNILEDTNVTNDAEIHKTEDDVWLCLEGIVDFVCDGEMVDTWFGKNADGSENKNEIKAKSIRGGNQFTLQAGDWLWVPAGVPHQHMTSGTARLIIIKIPRAA